MRRRLRWWPAALYAGAVAGILGQVLLLRLNPDIAPIARTFLLGVPLWMSWGAFLVGLPLLMIVVLCRRLLLRWGVLPGDVAVALLVLVFLLGSALDWVNADVHPEFLSAVGRRQLQQDAAMWLSGAVLTLALAAVWRRMGRRRTYAMVLMPLALLLPVARLMGEPTSFRQPLAVTASPLGIPSRSLVVCAVEGLDANVLLTNLAARYHPTLDRLMSEGAWGPMDPFRPFLDQAYWTTLATGTLPRTHGVMFPVGWQYPAAFDGTLRLLPWTPQGSRLFLAWDRGRRVAPPPSSIPPLWHRLVSSGVPTTVLDWPGPWEPDVEVQKVVVHNLPWAADPSLVAALEALLVGSFPQDATAALRHLHRDGLRVEEAVSALRAGDTDVWLTITSLGEIRRRFEPQSQGDLGQREVLALTLEFVDEQLGRLVEALPQDGLAAIVSPYGLTRPDALERIRRLLGIGGKWKASAENCPDGTVLLIGPGVTPGVTLPPVALEDLAPTLCYLLDLPVAQYMEGRVVVEAVDPEWLASHPLRVVD